MAGQRREDGWEATVLSPKQKAKDLRADYLARMGKTLEPDAQPTTYDGWLEHAGELLVKARRIRCDDLDAQRRARVSLTMAIRDAVERAMEEA